MSMLIRKLLYGVAIKVTHIPLPGQKSNFITHRKAPKRM